MWTQFWQTSQQAANAWRTSPPRAAAPVRALIQQTQPLPQPSAASHAQSVIPSIDVSRAALATPFTAASQSSRRAPLSARPAPLSFRSGEASAREQSQQATTHPRRHLPHPPPHCLQAAPGPSKPCVVFVLGGPGCGKGTQVFAAASSRVGHSCPLPAPSARLLHPSHASPPLQFCSAPGYRRRSAGRREQCHCNLLAGTQSVTLYSAPQRRRLVARGGQLCPSRPLLTACSSSHAAVGGIGLRAGANDQHVPQPSSHPPSRRLASCPPPPVTSKMARSCQLK
jgi:hypothetical protein